MPTVTYCGEVNKKEKMEIVDKIVAYVVLHKDWFQSIFSGIGVVVGAYLMRRFFKKKRGAGAGGIYQNQRGGNNSINIQIGKNDRRKDGE
ncbi:hypothetical protein [Burkholderia cepacia]|uniref:hypothetical protein n=1 Tax=Burkholderia cepacia TaxID=292 RepID=UPI0012D9297B|nr:hypothetical protein [Burkholderia cepacia]